MRISNFLGIVPKTKPQALQMSEATIAENVDLYSGVIVPIKAPQYVAKVVTEVGNEYVGIPKMVIPMGGVYVGFPEEHHWVLDPRNSAGANTVLFVRDGRLMRTSERMVRNGATPLLVGIDAPEKAPTVATQPDIGCEEEAPTVFCGVSNTCEGNENDTPPRLRSYVMTYVNSCGEESRPSEASTILTIKSRDGVSVVDANTPPADAVSRRIYRSEATTDGKAVWLFVAETAIKNPLYIDVICSISLGEELSTQDDYPPSKCLEGVSLSVNLQTIVWENNQFWVSQVRLPHAYPLSTNVTLPHKIKFVQGYTPMVEEDSHYNTGIVTDGYPYVAEVGDRGIAVIKELEHWVPAVSEFSKGVFLGGIVYASTLGLVHITGATVNIITGKYMTEHEWKSYNPTTIRLAGVADNLHGWFTTPKNTRRGFLIVTGAHDKLRPPSFSETTPAVTHGLLSPELSAMLVLIGNSVYAWGKGTDYLRYKWRSKVEVHSGFWSPGIVKLVSTDPNRSKQINGVRRRLHQWKKRYNTLDESVFFDEHPQFKWAYHILTDNDKIQCTLYCDGEEWGTFNIDVSTGIRLPRRWKGFEWSIEVAGTKAIREIHLQKSADDLTAEGGHA